MRSAFRPTTASSGTSPNCCRARWEDRVRSRWWSTRDCSTRRRAGRRRARVVAKVEHHAGELFPRVGFIVTNLTLPSRAVVRFYNKRGTAEQWIKEGKQAVKMTRSEEHTSELQSPCNLVCRLLLEKKKKQNKQKNIHTKFE